MEHLDNAKIVTLETFNDVMHANLMRTKLEAAGIECALMDENIVLINPLYTQAVGGVKLKVREEDLEKARAILHTMGEAADDEIDAEEEVVCSHCGSKDTVLASGQAKVLATMWAMFLTSFPFYNKKHYYCKSCKRYFKIKLGE